MENPVDLGVVEETLSSREHAVVVHDYRRSGGGLIEVLAVNGTDPGDDTVGRSLPLQFFVVSPLPLGCDRHGAILNKGRAIVQKVREIFLGCAESFLATALNRFRSGFVTPPRYTRPQLFEARRYGPEFLFCVSHGRSLPRGAGKSDSRRTSGL